MEIFSIIAKSKELSVSASLTLASFSNLSKLGTGFELGSFEPKWSRQFKCARRNRRSIGILLLQFLWGKEIPIPECSECFSTFFFN